MMKGALRFMQYVFPCSLQCEDVISMDPGETLTCLLEGESVRH